jgi:hypothetical protein
MRNASLHGARDEQRFVNFAEIVIRCEQRDGVGVVFKFFGKAIRQTGEAAVVHLHGGIGALHVRRCASGLPFITVFWIPVHFAGE